MVTIVRVALLALLLAAVVGASHACTVLDDPPPKNTCRADTDCFRAQGEICDVQAHICIQAPIVDALIIDR